jgi:hypothetical protein
MLAIITWQVRSYADADSRHGCCECPCLIMDELLYRL